MTRRILLFVLSLLLVAGNARAQSTGQITGTVTAATGQPLSGATVAISGLRRTTITDPQGRFTFNNVPAGTHTVTASRLGQATGSRQVTVAAGQTATADFQLQVAAVGLEAVVAVGYGQQRARDVTGSVSSIRGADLTQVPAANPADALKGRVAGVDVTMTSPEPGAAARIRVRGARSISAGNDPLYVVDGVPISGDLRDIDQNSIESIDVLKDASAAAVYGSRGANGVVLITTKRGRAGRTTFTYNTSYGTSHVLHEVDMMNGEEFAEMRREAQRQAGTYACPGRTACAAGDAIVLDDSMRKNLAAGISTDWQKEIMRTGILRNNQISMAGGNDNTRFRVGVGYLNQDGITTGQGYEAKQASFNFGHDFGRLDLQLTTQASRTLREAGVGARLWDEALFNSPLGRARADDGTILFKPTRDELRVNPILEARNNVRELTRTNVLATLSATLELAQGLSLVSSFGPQYSTDNDGVFVGTFTRKLGGTSLPEAGVDIEKRTSYTFSNYLQLDRRLGSQHRVQGTLLYEISQTRTDFDSAYATQLPYSQQMWYNLGSGGGTPALKAFLGETALQSYMGRLNYTFRDRYALTLTGRIDGSSVLAEGHKYAFFPAVGASWRLGDEGFMDRFGFLDDLKVRASFGRVGSSGIGAYSTLGQLSQQWYTFGTTTPNAVGFAPGSIPNPELQWETTDKYNLGVDFAVLDSRVSGSFETYRENTHNLLLRRILPFTTGYSSVLQNVGSTTNAGVEVALNTVNLDGWHGLTWESNLNVSTNRNRITALAQNAPFDVGNTRWVNAPINVNYDYKFVGIWQTADSAMARQMCSCKPGEIRVADTNGDGVINSDDRVFIGNHYNFPKWQGSFNNRFTYGPVDLSVLATARIGYTVRNGFIEAYTSLAARFNSRDVDYWTPDNPTNANPQPNLAGRGPYGSSSYYQNGSHVRIRDITLGYRLPERLVSRFGGQATRLYVKATDPFIFTRGFDGWDPENGFNIGDGNSTNSQIDVGGPSYRTFTFGADLTF
jgi:TonB-linked SusC/RagA family outer membrane protein